MYHSDNRAFTVTARNVQQVGDAVERFLRLAAPDQQVSRYWTSSLRVTVPIAEKVAGSVSVDISAVSGSPDQFRLQLRMSVSGERVAQADRPEADRFFTLVATAMQDSVTAQLAGRQPMARSIRPRGLRFGGEAGELGVA